MNINLTELSGSISLYFWLSGILLGTVAVNMLARQKVKHVIRSTIIGFLLTEYCNDSYRSGRYRASKMMRMFVFSFFIGLPMCIFADEWSKYPFLKERPDLKVQQYDYEGSWHEDFYSWSRQFSDELTLEEQLEWLATQSDVSSQLIRDLVFFTYASGYAESDRRKVFRAIINNPIIEKVVRLDCTSFIKYYLQTDDAEIPALTEALIIGNNHFLDAIYSCERQKNEYRDVYRLERIRAIVDRSLMGVALSKPKEIDSASLQKSLHWLINLGLDVDYLHEGHSGLYYAALNENLALMEAYLNNGVSALSDAEIMQLSKHVSREVLQIVSDHKVMVDRFLHFSNDVDGLLSIIEMTRENPGYLESLPLDVRGKGIYLAVTVAPSLWQSIMNPFLNSKKELLIVETLETISSYTQLNHLLSYDEAQEHSLKNINCEAARKLNHEVSEFLPFNDFTSMPSDSLQYYWDFYTKMYNTWDFNRCKLSSNGISFSPG